MKDCSMIVTNTGVYEMEVYDPKETIPEYGKAYVLRENIEETDIFYLFRGKLHDNSVEPGVYLDENELVKFIEPTEKERDDYIVYTHLSKMAPGDMMVVLKNKKNIQHVYNESSKLFMPGIEETDDILKRALKEAFNAKEVCIEDCKQGFPDKNAFFNFSSVMRKSDGKVSFLLFDRGCQALNLGYTIILHELDNDNCIGKSLDNSDVKKELVELNSKYNNPLVDKNSINLDGTIVVSSEDTFSA